MDSQHALLRPTSRPRLFSPPRRQPSPPPPPLGARNVFLRDLHLARLARQARPMTDLDDEHMAPSAAEPLPPPSTATVTNVAPLSSSSRIVFPAHGSLDSLHVANTAFSNNFHVTHAERRAMHHAAAHSSFPASNSAVNTALSFTSSAFAASPAFRHHAVLSATSSWGAEPDPHNSWGRGSATGGMANNNGDGRSDNSSSSSISSNNNSINGMAGHNTSAANGSCHSSDSTVQHSTAAEVGANRTKTKRPADNDGQHAKHPKYS